MSDGPRGCKGFLRASTRRPCAGGDGVLPVMERDDVVTRAWGEDPLRDLLHRVNLSPPRKRAAKKKPAH